LVKTVAHKAASGSGKDVGSPLVAVLR